MQFTWKHAAISLFVLNAVICIFTFSRAENNSETPKSEDILLHGGVFDSNVSPENYLRNGNFYSEDKGRVLMIDSSYIDPVKASIYWYDKVINEFPNTPECNQALKEKIKTIVGWRDGYGDNERHYGLKKRVGTEKLFRIIQETFQKLEMDYPDDQHLEAYAFQIAQAYFYQMIVYRKDYLKEKYEEWLRKTIELSNDKDTFYSHLAGIRLSGQK